MLPARLRRVCGEPVAGSLFCDLFVATAERPGAGTESANGGTGTLREMALVCGQYFIDWSGGDDDVEFPLPTSAHDFDKTRTSDDDRRDPAARGRATGAGRRTIRRRAVAEDRGRQARGVVPGGRSRRHLRGGGRQDISIAG